MIWLIGGSSHVGKTLLAQKLLEKYKYPYLSLDHLKMGLIRAGLTSLTVEDDLKMRYFLWPVAAEMIKTAIENRQNLIVEGCYIPGTWRESFTEPYLREIRCEFIVMTEDYIRRNIGAIKSFADVIETRISDAVDTERLVRCSRNFREDCRKYNIPCLTIGTRFDIEEIIKETEKLFGCAEDGSPM